MLIRIRPAVFACLITLLNAGSATAFMVDADHRLYRDHIVQLFTMLEEVNDEAPMARAQRLHILGRIGMLQRMIVEAKTVEPTEIQRLMRQHPDRAVPQLAVPVANQIANELTRAAEENVACLRAPEVPCLLDAAAALAAAEGNPWSAQKLHLTIARTARLADDNARLAVLRQMAAETVETIERFQRLMQDDMTYIWPHVALDFRMAGFVTEAQGAANMSWRKTRWRASSPEHIVLKIIDGERRWREGRLSVDDIWAMATQGMTGSDGKEESVLERRFPYLALTVLNDVSPDDRFRIYASGLASALPDPDERNKGVQLATNLALMNRADMLRTIPQDRRAAMLTTPKPGDTDAATATAIVNAMGRAALLGERDHALEMRSQLLAIYGRLPASPKPDMIGGIHILNVRDMNLFAVAETALRQ